MKCFYSSYQCGSDYHAPTDCETIKRWLTKCADDSETANYISAHTKDVRPTSISVMFFLAYQRITLAVPQMQHLHREERRLQPHAVLPLQARLLLDVPGRLEDSRIRVLRVFAVQGEPQHRSRVGARAGQGSTQKVPALL